MSTIITRLYRDQTAAKSVMDALKDAGFLDTHMDMFAGGATKSTDEDDDGKAKSKRKSKSKSGANATQTKLMNAGVYPKAAQIYAQHLAGGEALVVLRAPFRTSVTGVSIMDSFQPVRSSVKHDEVHVNTRDRIPSANRSRHLPPLVDGQVMSRGSTPGLIQEPTPFSSMFGMPTIVEKKGNARLIKSKPFMSSRFLGMPMLLKSNKKPGPMTRNPTPFSSMLGLPLLTKSK